MATWNLVIRGGREEVKLQMIKGRGGSLGVRLFERPKVPKKELYCPRHRVKLQRQGYAYYCPKCRKELKPSEVLVKIPEYPRIIKATRVKEILPADNTMFVALAPQDKIWSFGLDYADAVAILPTAEDTEKFNVVCEYMIEKRLAGHSNKFRLRAGSSGQHYALLYLKEFNTLGLVPIKAGGITKEAIKIRKERAYMDKIEKKYGM